MAAAPLDEIPGTITTEQLCTLSGLTGRHLRRLAAAGKFPPPNNGRYQIGKTLLGIISYQRELIQKKNGALAKEQVGLTKARRQTAEEELSVMRGEYVEKAVIGPKLRNVSLHQRGTLQRILEQQLGPTLAGLTTIEILEKMKSAVDEVCQIFFEGAAQWMEAPPTVLVK
jgi:hypothetical protein